MGKTHASGQPLETVVNESPLGQGVSKDRERWGPEGIICRDLRHLHPYFCLCVLKTLYFIMILLPETSVL